MSKLYYEDEDRNEVVPKIKGAKPCMSQVLIEKLTEKEQLGTQLHLTGKNTGDVPQAYILAMGPSLMADIDKWGFKVGDRVIVSGNYTPVPNYDKSHREKGLIEPSCIKGVLEEEV